MKIKHYPLPPACRLLLAIAMLLLLASLVSAQNVTTVSGNVIDAKTKETMPAVTVEFIGIPTGTSADNRGHYTLKGAGALKQVKFSFIGYRSVIKDITPGQSQVINISLTEDTHLLKEVVINAGKKSRYRNKGNPAVELIREVIAHKAQNRVENY